MKVTYRTKTLEKVSTDLSVATRKYGQEMAERIQMRIDQIRAVDDIEQMLQYKFGRCHPLKGDRKGYYAVDLVQPYRLIFEVLYNEIQIANIFEIADYH